MNRFYMNFHAFFKPIFAVLYPMSVEGLEHLREDTPVVFCANHASALDPILFCLALPRRVPMRMMAKKELMDTPLLGWLLRKLGGFGVDRGNADLAAVKTAMKAIKDGNNLLVFPEGTRVDYEGEVRAKGGVVMIAMRTGAMLQPVFVDGKKRLFRRTRIVFGEAYTPVAAARRATAEEYQTFADDVLHRAYALGQEAEK